MTPAELTAWMTEHDCSRNELAYLLGVDPVTITRWLKGKVAMQPYLWLALRELGRGRRKRA